ncbi:MAG: hypothetical protein LBP24_00355 [Coriobacteriales bacterium]|jgi:type II secretory pathway component PulM|nr:hypothetical protein [Coriobacteriales bacterium]
MALFGILPPAAAIGRHARTQAVIPAGAVKHTKKEPNALMRALSKLSLRERIMIITLIVVAIVAALTFLVVLPAIERVSALESEVATLRQQKNEIREDPDLTPQYEAAYETALQDYANYQHFYYSFMDPETIDRTITNLLLEHELTPMRLAMTTIEPAALPLYSGARTLAPRPVPPVEEAGTAPEKDEDADKNTGAEDAAGTADDTREGAAGEAQGASEAQEVQGRAEQLATAAEEAGGVTGAGDGTGSPTGAAGTAGTSIYCYTVDIEAKGWLEQLLSFLESTRGIIAMEVVSYSYAAPGAEIPGSGGISSTKPTGISVAAEEPGGGTITMQIKLYVFVSGDMTVGSVDNR